MKVGAGGGRDHSGACALIDHLYVFSVSPLCFYTDKESVGICSSTKGRDARQWQVD